MRILSILLILIFAPLPALAADTRSLAATEPPSEYDVELLVFLREAAPDNEQWPAAEELPSPAKAVATVDGTAPPEFPPDMRSDGEVMIPSRPTPARPSNRIKPLGANNHQLTAEAETLRRHGMTPLIHAAWRQVVGERNNRDWLWLENGPLYGLVRISLGRYLHIDTDLAMMFRNTADGAVQTTRIMEHRRMRSGELHHIDHPGFGILVQINRHEPPEAVDTPRTEPLMLETLGAQPAAPDAPAGQ